MPDKPNQPQPLLQFHGPGGYAAEYMPTGEFELTKWFCKKYVSLRTMFGLDIYYWHIRYLFSPELCKTNDLLFMMHVFEDHRGAPTDPVEQRHFKKAMKRYGRELTYVMKEIAKSTDDGVAAGHAYAYAYQTKWLFLPQNHADKTLYHGVKEYDLLDVFEESLRLLDQFIQENDEEIEAAEKKEKRKKKTPAQRKKSDS